MAIIIEAVTFRQIAVFTAGIDTHTHTHTRLRLGEIKVTECVEWNVHANFKTNLLWGQMLGLGNWRRGSTCRQDLDKVIGD